MSTSMKLKLANDENRCTSLRKRQQFGVTEAIHRKAFNEIGNLLQQSYSRKASVAVNRQKDVESRDVRSCQNEKIPRSCSNCSNSMKLMSTSIGKQDGGKWKSAVVASSLADKLEENSKASLDKDSPIKPQCNVHQIKRAPRLTMKPPADSPLKDLTVTEIERKPNYLERVSCKVLVKRLQPISCNAIPLCATKRLQVPLKGNYKLKEARKPIPQIEAKNDIDLLYNKCLWMVTSYSSDIFSYLLKLETEMARGERISQTPTVDAQTRVKLVNWLALIYYRLQLCQETFQLSVSIMDRFVQRGNYISQNATQLLALCSLLLSIKYEEVIPASINNLLAFSNQSYTKKDVFAMEANILRTLDFRIATPVAIVFLRRFNVAAKSNRAQHSCGKYLIDLALLDEHLCTTRASKLAAASVFISTCVAKNEVKPEMWNTVLHHYTSYAFEEIRPVVSEIATKLMLGVDRNCFLKKKYLSAHYHNVSENLEQHATLLEKLANL